jgi:hypothetical protein
MITYFWNVIELNIYDFFFLDYEGVHGTEVENVTCGITCWGAEKMHMLLIISFETSIFHANTGTCM